jgi:hypothetical protein
MLAMWGAFALWYRVPGGSGSRLFATMLWAVFCVLMLGALWTRSPLIGIVGFALAFGCLLLWWRSIRASNSLAWADDVAQMTCGTVTGQQVVLNNVRNFDWRTKTDYVRRWETRSYDLSQLACVDMITSYWTIQAIAHVLISFGFEDGQHIVFSVEVRRQKAEAYSTLGGFFKGFQLSVIAADERDAIRVRTNVRGEDDYLYRIQLPAAARRALFLAYVNEAGSLIDTPRFYNTLTANCTTLIYHMMQGIVGHLPLDYRLLLSGYLPGYVYKVGGLDRRYSLEQLRKFGRITDRARAADRSAQFSADIRAGIPSLPMGS